MAQHRYPRTEKKGSAATTRHNARVKRRRAQGSQQGFPGPLAGFGGGSQAAMSVKGSRVRVLAVAMVFALLLGALWVRAFQVQILEGEAYAARANRQHVASESVAGERGRILDRKGRLLAKSVPVRSAFCRPLEVEDPHLAAATLAPILDIPSAKLLRKLTARGAFVWLSRQIGDKTAAALETAVQKAGLSGVHLTTEFGRLYPNRNLAGKLLGFTGVDNDGLEGLEAAFQERLAGSVSRYVVTRDAAGHVLYLDTQGNEVDPRGEDVTLTIDAQIQFMAEEVLARTVREYGGDWGGAITVEVETGEVLAFAEYPTFNPNAYRGLSSSAWRNRLVLDAFEPGSTVKPFLIAAAMDEHVTTPDELVFCENGTFRYGGASIKDSSGHEYGWLPVHKVLRYSSNIGMAKIGIELGASPYYDYLAKLGFGQKTGLPLPGENTGILRQPGSWQDLDLAAASFGQGFSVTMTQLARAYLCLLNHGVTRDLVLVADPPQPRSPEVRVFSRQSSDAVLAMLRDVVMGDGTGTKARIPGLSVGGKTGTAQKAGKGGYGEDYVASFVGFFPAEDPKFMTLVVVDEPTKHHYGGLVAAPVFREISVKTLAYLGSQPERTGLLPSLLTENEAAETLCETPLPVLPKLTASFEAQPASSKVCDPATASRVPDVRGMSLRQAVDLFAGRGVVPRIMGQGAHVARQDPAPGSNWPQADEANARRATIWLTPEGRG